MSERINHLFTEYHGRYDLANSFYSLGIDRKWRRDAVKEAMIGKNGYSVLDIATGTAEIALLVAKNAAMLNKDVAITGMDSNREMLAVGREKVRKSGFRNISLVHGDALSMGLKDSSFDVATCAFALRNFDDLGKFFKELHRVLKRNGKFVILEMGNPDDPKQRFIFRFYFGVLMRPIAYIIGIDAYKWLLYSITHFDKKAAISLLRAQGFRDVRTRPLETGVGFLITGRR